MEDKGKHYRYTHQGVKMDPYRICQVYDIGGGPREHAVKKLLRGTEKDHSERDMWLEVQACATRALEMIDEDENPAMWIDHNAPVGVYPSPPTPPAVEPLGMSNERWSEEVPHHAV